MSGNLWMFSDMLDDEDIEMQKHDFITLYQGADYYGLGLKVFTRMAREAGSVYKIGKKALIRRTIFDEYLRKVYKKELEKNSSDDSGKELMKRQGTMVTDEDSGRMDIRFGLWLREPMSATLLFPSTFVQITLPDTPVLAWIGEPGNGMHISISKRSIIIWVCIRTRVLPYVLAVQLKQGFTILSYWNTGTV